MHSKCLRHGFTVLVLMSGMLMGCGEDKKSDGSCDVGDNSQCDDGFVCEVVTGETKGACFAPVEIRGMVMDSSSGDGIADATVVALDVNGSARTSVVTTDAAGSYALPIAMERDADGNPVEEQVTLRASAADYQTFPTAPRTAVPFELSMPVAMDGVGVVQNAATDVSLIALPADAMGLAKITGVVEADDAGGVLVVAVQGGKAVASAVTGSAGTFTLFNVPAGATSVEGFRGGLVVTPADVTVDADVTDVTLQTSTEGLGSVSGSVNFVEGGAPPTSVILVLESTFVEAVPAVARGEAPPGLRVGDVDGPFTIVGVPPGKYVVLAGFENDDLVRDPSSIGGTEIPHIEVMAGQEFNIETAFKLTLPLDVVSPGADGIETLAAAPVLEWADDSSEDGYEVRLYNAFGEVVYMDDAIPKVSGAATVSVDLSGETLDPGMIYQFRAVSFKDGANGREYLSATEDLKGTFVFEPTVAP